MKYNEESHSSSEQPGDVRFWVAVTLDGKSRIHIRLMQWGQSCVKDVMPLKLCDCFLYSDMPSKFYVLT